MGHECGPESCWLSVDVQRCTVFEQEQCARQRASIDGIGPSPPANGSADPAPREDEMPNGQPRVRQNYWAVIVSAIACFLLAEAWYTYFLDVWLEGIGRTRQWLTGQGVNPVLQYITALLSLGLIAASISCLTQLTGEQTAARGMKVAGLLWLGVVLTTWATEYVFELRAYSVFAINTGFWLIAMVIMGAIVGGWRKK
jgi:Protein of unknown function (DUF1761)